MFKVFATIFIVFHHYQQDGQGITGQKFHCFVDFYDGTFYWGNMVELFFLISGFCMLPYIQRILEGQSFYQFYTRRAARLLPMMAVSGVVSALLLMAYDRIYAGNGFDLGTPSIFGVILQSLGLQEGWVFTNPSINNPTWYCSVLLLCYLIFYGIVYWAGRLKISPYYGMVFFIFLGCGINTYGISLPFLNATSSRGFYAFFAGVLLAALMPRIKSWRYSMPVSLLVVLAVAVTFMVKGSQLEYFAYLLTFVLYPAAIVLMQSMPFRLISGRPFWGKWAKISYSIFIWHFPMYLLLFLVLPLLHIDPVCAANQNMMFLFALVMQPIGWLSYRLIEKPLNQKALNWLAAGDPARQPEKV